MATVRLTKTVVEAEAPGPTPRFVWDASLSGFGVKITPAGGRVYVVQYRPKASRETRRYTLGRHGAPWTTAKAREAAADLLARIRLGEDPFVSDQAARATEQAAVREGRAAKTRAVAEAFPVIVEQFVEKYAKPRNRSWAESQRILTSPDVLAWQERQVSSIKRKDVIQVIDAVATRSEPAARLLFAHLRKLFNWCVERQYVEVSPCLGLKGPATNRPRDRWLSDDELRLVWLATYELGWPFAPLFRLLILTGQRREEVSAIAWAEVDLDKAEWTIPAARAKNGKAHVVDLSPLAREILEAIKGREGLVFTTTGDTPVSGHSRAKARLDDIVEEARQQEAVERGEPQPTEELAPWRIHDLRRTAATGMARLGSPPHVVEAVLNHVSGSRGGLVAVYQHYDHRPERRAALLAWSEHVGKIVG